MNTIDYLNRSAEFYSENSRRTHNIHSDELRCTLKVTIEHEREDDVRWLAEVPELPGVLAYGATADDAIANAEILALLVLARITKHETRNTQD